MYDQLYYFQGFTKNDLNFVKLSNILTSHSKIFSKFLKISQNFLTSKY